jgi:hypothetical protein
MAAQIQIEGLRELRKAIREAGDKELQKALRLANKAAATVVVADASPSIPVLTGRLKKSARALGSQRSGRAVMGGARLPYAPPIHWGWPRHNIARRPVLLASLLSKRPAIRTTYDKALDAVRQRLRSF